MKGNKKWLALLVAGCMALPLAACGGEETVREVAYELPYYDGNYTEELDDPAKPAFNSELWRRADTTIDGGADPMVLDDTARSGYFYVYVTGFTYYYSKDLKTWQNGGSFVSLPADLSGSGDTWAPEVIYDEDTDLYYAFFTLNPPADAAYELESAPTYMPIVATSESAAGPFVPVTFDDRNLTYPQFYVKYCLFDNPSYIEAFARENLPDDTAWESIYTFDGGYVEGDEGWVRAIDFHPWVDPDTGEKYLYWSQTPGSIAGVKMDDWLTPDWSTYKTLTACGYYTMDDYVKAMNGETVETVYYEQIAAYCNEGPFMIKHNGKYYLTFSIGAYDQSSYGVMQAVSDSPLGPFRKLSDSENGMLINNDIGENPSAAGPGHHSFFTLNVNGTTKLIMAYHAHNMVNVYTGRHVQFDEVKWVTVKDINGNDLDVMHVNGPTVSVQPSFGYGSEYGDVSDAIESATLVHGGLAEGSSATDLADGLVSYYTVVSQPFEETYVKEAEATVTSTFEITLKEPTQVRGIMFYNSNDADTMFDRITDIAFICEEDGHEKIYYIEELLRNDNTSLVYDALNERYEVVYASSVYAEFAGINVKSIRFTLEVPEDQQSAAIQEVALVGKFCA